MLWLKHNIRKIVLSLMAVSLILAGIFLWYQPQPDRDQYNLALEKLEKGANLNFEDLHQAEEGLRLYREAKDIFLKVGMESESSGIRAKANYNLAALLTREIFTSGQPDSINLAIEKLQLSLRDDSQNVKSKFYLELLLNLKNEISKQEAEDGSSGQNESKQPKKPVFGKPKP